MFDFYKKRKFKSLIYSKTFLIIISIPVFLMFFATFNAYKKERNVKKEQKELSANLSLLQARKERLESEIEKLNTKRGVEEELREKFELGKEGERAIVFVEEKQEDDKKPKIEKKQSFWKKIFNF